MSKKEQSTTTIFVCISSKGGVGKTTVSNMLASYIYNQTNTPVNYFEVDQENQNVKSLSKSQILNPSLVALENLKKLLEESIMWEGDTVLDIGGNASTTTFINHLKLTGGFLAKTIYFIPLSESDQDIINAKDTHSSIREFDQESHIVYVLNKCQNKSNVELTNRQFINFHGSDILGVEPTTMDKHTTYIAMDYNTIYNVTGRLGKTIYELSSDNYDDEYKTVAQEFFKDKSNQDLYKQVRRLMFLKEMTSIAREVVEKEYLDLFAQIKKIQKS